MIDFKVYLTLRSISEKCTLDKEGTRCEYDQATNKLKLILKVDFNDGMKYTGKKANELVDLTGQVRAWDCDRYVYVSSSNLTNSSWDIKCQ